MRRKWMALGAGLLAIAVSPWLWRHSPFSHRTPCTPTELGVALMLDRIILGKANPCELDALDIFIRDRQAQAGPWNQDIRVARSSDGLTFTTVVDRIVLATAAVPEVVVGPDGRYYLFHVDGDFTRLREMARHHSPGLRIRGLPGIGALALAVSEDGLHFSPVEDFGIEGLVRGMVVDPDIVPLPGGHWRMYYVGLPSPEFAQSTWKEGEHHRVYSAISKDLIHWRQEGEVVRGPYADPTVECGTGVDHPRKLDCVMFSFGLDRSVSRDGGRSFQYEGSWNLPGFAPELLRLETGSIRLYYNDKHMGAPMRSLISVDGIHWDTEAGERLDQYGEAPTVARASDGSWLLYYHTFKSPEDIPSRKDGLSNRQRKAGRRDIPLSGAPAGGGP